MDHQPPGGGRKPAPVPAPAGPVARWVCRCQEPPIVLGTYGSDGWVHIKARDRYWHVLGRVEAVCPRCGTLHLLDRQDTVGDRRSE